MTMHFFARPLDWHDPYIKISSTMPKAEGFLRFSFILCRVEQAVRVDIILVAS